MSLGRVSNVEKERKANRRQKSKANSRQKCIANSRQKSIANSRQKSKANRRQKSRANSRQGKPKGYHRDKAKYEEKQSTEESCSQQVPEHLKTDADVQEEQRELKFDDVLPTSTRESWSTERASRQLRNSDTESPEKK